jgi:MraZ protein
MKLFDGEYPSTLDKQGRFVMPVGIRKQMPEDECVFAIARGKDKCLYLYPVEAWEEQKKNLKAVNTNDDMGRAYVMLSLRGSQIVSVDAGGRFPIPQQLIQYAGLTKDIVIHAELEKFAIYSKEYFDKFFEIKTMDDLRKHMGGDLLNELGKYMNQTYGI